MFKQAGGTSRKAFRTEKATNWQQYADSSGLIWAQNVICDKLLISMPPHSAGSSSQMLGNAVTLHAWWDVFMSRYSTDVLESWRMSDKYHQKQKEVETGD